MLLLIQSLIIRINVIIDVDSVADFEINVIKMLLIAINVIHYTNPILDCCDQCYC